VDRGVNTLSGGSNASYRQFFQNKNYFLTCIFEIRHRTVCGLKNYLGSKPGLSNIMNFKAIYCDTKTSLNVLFLWAGNDKNLFNVSIKKQLDK